jgi:F-type H+-transporting ATPase subunit epsilon
MIRYDIRNITPERRLYSGEVYGVQLPGIHGKFEVLNVMRHLLERWTVNVKVIKDKNINFLF